ncbi:hypothetical protein [Polyangium sp. 6x1]|uniref:hypothetical protein n=1 Tax=Polyangium sp. 6x1 TaxID=3042689 RepID=UPI0024829211|nr:hypothetical protein [Polyangium sp. 6x1]MDI1449868.1 hypothetical protein [Polyangium sp. 6x1]
MKTTLGLLALLFTSACSGPEVPSAFQPESPASPAASPAPRPPVAAVLVASDPLEADVCAPGKPCVLPGSQGASQGGDGPPHGGHPHGNHGGHDHGGHSGHSGHPH